MFGMFTKKITQLTNHYIDFSRIGELLQTNHHYNQEEIITRTKIITATAVSGILGSYLNNKDKTNCSDLTMGLLLSTFGFILSHSIVILPLIKKRHDMSHKCDHLIIDIHSRINYLLKIQLIDLSIKEKVISVLNLINKLSLSDAKHARASQTWGRKITLLLHVSDALDIDPQKMKDFWSDDVDLLMIKLFNDAAGEKKNTSGFLINSLKK